MTDIIRKVESGFFRRWGSLADDDKVKDKEFDEMYKQITNDVLSFYKGDGSQKFLNEIAAANCISRGHVRDTELLILRTNNGCIMLIPSAGTTGVKKVDDAHVIGGGISTKGEFLEILNSVIDDDVRTVDENTIYDVIVSLEKVQIDLPSKYKFSDRVLRLLEDRGGGPYTQ